MKKANQPPGMEEKQTHTHIQVRSDSEPERSCGRNPVLPAGRRTKKLSETTASALVAARKS